MTNFRYFANAFLVTLALWLVGHRAVAQNVESELKTLKAWRAGAIVSTEAIKTYGEQRCFSQEAIPDAVFARMEGRSFPKDCTVNRQSLRYVRLLHVDVDGRTRLGEMVCNKLIAADVIDIFRELYRQHYPIHSIKLIDDFNADDEQSMRANNTSSFCFRKVTGSKKLSAHAMGKAIDVNPLYNPYYHRSPSGKITVQPTTATKYVDRAATFPYKITKTDLMYQLFIAHGFKWGGAWNRVKDYQHFEKE